MNKPASSEPSMDEILSSIRQIIADEDDPQAEQATQPSAPVQASEPVNTEADADAAMMAAEPMEAPVEFDVPEILEEPQAEEPLALSPDQMIAETTESEAGDEISFDEISAESPEISEDAPEATEQEPATDLDVPAEPEDSNTAIDMVIADDISFDGDEVEPAFEEPAFTEPEIEEPAISPTSLPDPELSAEMADKLLAPAADAAVRSTFSRLNALAIGGAELTLEGIVRDMLRPMLKEWLDENLPTTVERMVEKEIERVSRGG